MLYILYVYILYIIKLNAIFRIALIQCNNNNDQHLSLVFTSVVLIKL